MSESENGKVPATVKTGALDRSSGAKRRRPRRGFGLRGAVLLLTATLAIVMLGFFGLKFATTYWRSYERHLAHTLPVHDDDSIIVTGVRRQVRDDDVILVVRDNDGRLHRVAAGRQAAGRFLDRQAALLDAERTAIKAEIDADLDAAFAAAFADRDEAVGRFADWFFEWKRSYVLLKEAVSAAFDDLTSANFETIEETVNNTVADYLMRHYEAFVLRPEFRDPIVRREVERAFVRAHERYLRFVASQDLRLQLFLARQTSHLETIAAENAVDVRLDWDAQRWKAPIVAASARTDDALAGLATMGIGGVVGSKVVWPLIRGRLAGVYAGMVGRLSAGLTTRIGTAAEGAAVGTAVEPGGGTIVGGLVGLVAGIGIDWGYNEWREAVDRPQFVADNQAAVDASIAVWKAKIGDAFAGAVDVWFDDTRAAVAIERIAPPALGGAAAATLTQ